MDAEFWNARWNESKIGFHQDRPTPLLLQHWPSLCVPAGSRVFVPLCGKSLDLAWFASQGLDVLGVELSALAVEQFFAEHQLAPATRDSQYGRHFSAGGIEIICGDAFSLDAALLANCAAVFDRAALIALPDKLRSAYADSLYAALPAGCTGLLVTLEYPQHEKSGPPFSVDEAEVRERFGPRWRLDMLERKNILSSEPGFRAEGLTSLNTVAYRMQRR